MIDNLFIQLNDDLGPYRPLSKGLDSKLLSIVQRSSVAKGGKIWLLNGESEDYIPPIDGGRMAGRSFHSKKRRIRNV